MSQKFVCLIYCILAIFNTKVAFSFGLGDNLIEDRKQLEEKGWEIQSQIDGKVKGTYSNNHVQATIVTGTDSKNYKYSVSSYRIGGHQNYEVIKTYDKDLHSQTHCGPTKDAKGKYLCTTITPNFCHAILKLETSSFFSDDLDTLRKCGQALAKINYNIDEMKSFSEDNLKLLKEEGGINGSMVHHIPILPNPKTLFDLVQAYSTCSKFKGRIPMVLGGPDSANANLRKVNEGYAVPK